MNPVRAFKVMGKDLKLGPRSPIFLWALIYPFVITVVVQVIFGNLFAPQPRLGIVDKGRSRITARMVDIEGISLTLLDRKSELKGSVKDNDLDAGLFLKEGFDEAVRSGEKPLLEFWIGGESLASNRIILAVTTLDLIREVEGEVPPVDVKINTLGDREALSVSLRLIPFIVLFSLLISGVLVTSFGLVQERENKTLDAILVTPVRLSEVLAAKAGIGLTLAVLMALLTLFLNGALGSQLPTLLLGLLIAALMAVEFGLIFGTAVRDINTLFTLIKTMNIFILTPVIFYLFPDWPRWIAKIFPTYWIINPIFEIAIKDKGLSDVAFDLGIALGIIALLILPIMVLSKRLRVRLAAA
jgi:ABC-2 type transport system permease protein